MPEKKLTPEQVDQLNANAAQMQEQGYSVDEIKSMASQYFNEFASEEGEPVNFTPASSEQSEGQSEEQKKDGTPSKQQPSQPSEPVGEVVEEVKQPVDKFDIASFQLPDMPTDPVSQAKLKAQEQQEKSGQYIQEQIDIWEQAPEIAKRAVDDKNRDSYIKEVEAVINSDKERLQEIEAEFKILTGEDTTGKIEIPPGFTVQDYVKELSEEYTTLNRDVVTTSGALYDAKSDKGGFIGAFQNLLMEGYTSTVDGGVKFLLNTMAQTNPEAFGTEDVEEALVRARAAAKDMAVKETLDLQLKDKDTTEEYIQSVKDKGIITQGVLGAVESVGAIVLPAGMFTMSYNAAIDEVQDIEGLTESEKATYATGIATIEAGLEYFGLSQLVKGAPGVTSQISKKLFNKVLKKVPKESTEDVLQRAVSSEIRTFSDKLKAAADPEKFINAFLVEAETGGTQEATKLAAQKVINLYKDAELFELPEDIAGNIIESSIAEGIGGLTFGVGKGALSLLGGEKNFVANLSQKEFNELSNKLQDPQALQAIKDNIQAQVNLDPNKASQAQKTLEAVEELSGALKSVPADINNRKAVTNLMLDKIRLEKEAENAPDKTIYNKKINSLESKIDELIDAPEIVEETTEQPTTETTTEETTEQTSKESSRLQRRIDKAKSDFAAATDTEGKVKAVVNFFNDATVSTASVSKEDIAWYEASKAELEAEGYVFDNEIGRELSDNETVEVGNRRESDQVPKGVRIIERVSKPKRLVNGKLVERPIYDVIEGTGTTAEREALVAELEAAKDNMTPQNFKEARPRFDAATKALKDYDAANFTSPIQTEINTKTEETVEKTPLVTDESGEVVTVYRGGKPASGVQYYTSDEKLAKGIGEGKGEGVQKATVRMANPWTPESLDVNNAPQWMQDWVRSQEEFTTVDEETMAAEEIPMEQAIQEIKDMRLSFRDVGLWQSFVNEALEHHDGIIAFDPSEDMATDKKIYITKSPEQVVTEETTEDTTEGKKEVTNAEKTKIAEEIGKVRKVKPKNIKGLLDVMGGIFGLNKKQAESASVVGDVIIGNMAKRAGISKDEMYQKIAYQKANLEDIEKLSEKGKVLYQIAGENANLTQVIKDNLATARQMEATEDPKTIKIATGWERGADGKWRYETVDNIPFLKDTVRTINEFIVEEGLDNGTGILGGNGELILPLELLELYPQLKDVEIFFDRKMSEYEGAYYPNKNKIVVGLGVRPENSVRVLLHEVQHVIQKVEGFAKGGENKTTRTSEFIFSNIPTLETFRSRVKTDKAKSILSNEIDKVKRKEEIEVEKAKLRAKSSKLTFRDDRKRKSEIRDRVSKLSAEYSKLKVMSIADLKQELSALEPNLDEKIYEKLAGEVEARNVEKRMNMTSEQRRASILEETEDVARDEQVVLFKADGSLKRESPLFKSTAKEGLSKIQQKAATPEQWVKMITDKGGKGTSQELEWIGLQDYLNEWKKENKVKSVPKEVVEQYINDNQIEIVEVSRSEDKISKITQSGWVGSEATEIKQGDYSIRKTVMGDRVELVYEDGSTFGRRIGTYDSFQQAKEAANQENLRLIGQTSGTKYSQYTLEGGENYREVLLTLPKKKGQDYAEKMRNKYGKELDPMQIYEKMSESERETQAKLNNESEVAYKSSHWDEANILAHLRLNERTLPNGERVLFIEEVQSDWAQEGKKKGFGKATPVNREDVEIVSSGEWVSSNKDGAEYRLTLNIRGEEIYTAYRTKSVSDESINLAIESQIQRALDAYNNNLGLGRTPDMPYKKTDQWVGMAMRRAMQMAAQEGFDRVAWVTGEQSAERYDLSKQVDKIVYEPKNEEGERYVDIYMPSGLTTFLVSSDGVIISNRNTQIPQSEGKTLDEVIGKELADKILSSESNDTKTLDNEGLKVGGEGMKAFYNSILPKVAKKEAQRFDKKAKIEVVDFQPDLKINTGEYSIRPHKEFGGFFIEDKTGKRVGLGTFSNKKNAEYVAHQLNQGIKLEETKKQIPETRKNPAAPTQQLSIPITPEMRMNLNSAVPLFQGEQGAMLAEDGKYTIYALTDPNVSTPLHELAHVYEHYLTDSERAVIERWSGHSEGTVEFSESFARGFEKFLAGGKVNNPKLQKIFENFKKWLTEIYNGIKGSNIDIQLNSEMKAIYNKMLGSTEETTEVTTEETAPSKKRLDEQIDGIIKKVKDRTSDKADPKKVNKRAFDDAVEYLQTSLWYEKANDLQREASVIELMEKTKQPVKKSMTVKGAIKKAFPPTPEKRVSMTPLAALKKQIQDFGRGMREAAKDQRTTVKNANNLLKELQKSGVITARQAGALTRAASKVNFASPKSLENFTNRVEKTIKDIDYNTKLSDATSLKGKIKPKKNTLASDKARVNEFRKIDPKNVEDIDAYIEKANEIVASIKSPRRTAKGVSLPTAMDYAAIDEYNKTTLEEQDKKAKQSIKDQYDYLEDFDLTVEEMNEIISLLEQGKEPQLTDARKEQINERLNTLFTFYKPALEEKLTDKNLTKKEKQILKALKDGNINDLPFNEKARTIKVAENILQNNDFSAAQQVVNAIDAQQSVAEIQKADIKFDLRKGFFGLYNEKAYFQKVASLTQSMKFIFRGAKAADNFAVKTGMTDFDIGAVNATNRVDKIIDKYNDMVKNMDYHNTAVNIVKRRVYSFLTRNDGTTATEKKAEFDRRKGLINEQLEYLKLTDGEFAKELETVLSDLDIDNAQTLEDIQIDELNKKIVDFFVQEFEDLYDEHSEVAKVLYNKILPQDSKYLPDVFEKVDKSDMFVKLDESVYFEDAIDTKETSMLQDVSKPSSLPKVNGEVTRAINLDFDRIMMRKLEDAIKEIETAQSVDKLKKVLTTENLNKFLSPTQADLLKSKITNYVNAIRGKSIKQKEIADSKTVNKIIDGISNFAATKILGSATQPIKQTIPVYVRSGINMSSKGRSAMNNALIGQAPELVEIANKYGEVSLRGKQSVVDIDALSSKVDFDKLSDSVIKLVGISGAKNIRDAKKALSKAGEAPLKYALEKPDKWMATASWAGYYTDYLYKNKPDFNLKEELENPTKEAIQYANSRVSETQNESQREKMGDYFTSKSTTAKVLRNVILPFASFQQNLRTDVYTNIGIAKSKTASKEDKKIAQKSIASAITEMAIFNVLSVSLRALTTVGIGTLLGMDGDEDEERELDPILGIPLTKKDKKILYTNIISDAAPLPLVDDLALFVFEATNKLYKTGNGEQYDKYKDNIVYAPGSIEEIILNRGGKFGSAYDIITDTKTKLDMSDFLNEDGTFTKSSIYGDKEYPIPEYLENDINLMIGLQALYLMGAPKEFKTASDVIRKEIEAEAKIKRKPA